MKSKPPVIEFEKVAGLPFGEQLILWGIRLWVKSYKTKTEPKNMLSHGLKLAGVPGAFTPLNKLMKIISSTALRDIEVNCVECDVITLDEHVLIDAVGFWMNEKSFMAGQFTKIDFLPETATRIAESYFCDIGLCFKEAGHKIRRRQLTSSKQRSTKIPTSYIEHSKSIH